MRKNHLKLLTELQREYDSPATTAIQFHQNQILLQ